MQDRAGTAVAKPLTRPPPDPLDGAGSVRVDRQPNGAALGQDRDDAHCRGERVGTSGNASLREAGTERRQHGKAEEEDTRKPRRNTHPVHAGDDPQQPIVRPVVRHEMSPHAYVRSEREDDRGDRDQRLR